MAKKNKSKLMITFLYYDEQMFSWCNYNYVEGEQCFDLIDWDTKEQKRTSLPWRSDRGIEEYEAAMKEYNDKFEIGNFKKGSKYNLERELCI